MTGSPFFFSAKKGPELLVIPDMVAHWKFNEGSGTALIDATGNGRTGVINGSPTWGAGRYGGSCLNFDGTDDYVSVPDHASLNFGASQDFTVMVRVNTTLAAQLDEWPNILGKPDSGSPKSYWNLTQSESLEPDTWYFDLRIAGVNYGPTLSGNPTIRDGAWHDLVIQREGTTARAFQDAVQYGTTTNASVSGSLSNGDPVKFGQWLDTFWFTGSIDEARIFRRAITLTEITSIYNGLAA